VPALGSHEEFALDGESLPRGRELALTTGVQKVLLLAPYFAVQGTHDFPSRHLPAPPKTLLPAGKGKDS
jgi:hypothetical protein